MENNLPPSCSLSSPSISISQPDLNPYKSNWILKKGQLNNLQGPMERENVGPLVQKLLTISRQQLYRELNQVQVLLSVGFYGTI